MAAENKEMERLVNEKSKHRGEWLTEEAVVIYQRKARACSQTNGSDIGARREIRKELQERYGLLEIEAINILNGFYAKHYVEKYRRIRECIPLSSDNSKNEIEIED